MRSVFVLGIAFLISSCSADPNPQANSLFVEAKQLVEASNKQELNDKIANLVKAKQKLQEISTRFAASNIAVQLASGQISTLSTKAVDDLLIPAWQERSAASLQIRDFDRAVEDLNSIIIVRADDADALISRAWAFSSLGQPDRAIEDYTSALRINPNVSEVWLRRGIVNSSKGDLGRAISDYFEAIRLDPKNATYYITRARAFEKAGKRTEALADYRRAEALAGPSPATNEGITRLERSAQ